MSGEGMLQNDSQVAAGAGELSPCRRSGDRSPAGAPGALVGGHLQTVRRAVAESYRADGFQWVADSVERGTGDNLCRMRAATAAVSAVLAGMFE